MDKTEFYGKLAEILDVETLRGDDILRDCEQWDSLAVLSVLAMASASYGVNISAAEIRSVTTCADLSSLVEAKREIEAQAK